MLDQPGVAQLAAHEPLPGQRGAQPLACQMDGVAFGHVCDGSVVGDPELPEDGKDAPVGDVQEQIDAVLRARRAKLPLIEGEQARWSGIAALLEDLTVALDDVAGTP